MLQRVSRVVRRAAAGAAALAAATAFAGCAPSSPSHTSSSAHGLAVAQNLPKAPKKLYFGVYEPAGIRSAGQIANFAQLIGRQPQIVLYFSGWMEPFETSFAEHLHSIGAIPQVQLEPDNVSMKAIAAGRYDDYLRSFADGVRAFHHKVIIGFAHEMNGPWYKWGFGHTSPRVWVAAWRHLVTVFRHEGAANVVWLWTINRTVNINILSKWWPGAKYVSWVGIDGYYFFPTDDFITQFLPTVEAVRKITGKPVLLSEVGIGQVAGQAAKLPGMFAGIKQQRLLGLIWYDVTQRQGVYHQNWRLDENPAAIAAFRRGLKSLGLEP